MNMQDNELDDLFRSKLGGLEVKPAARVWTDINAELGGGTKKKSRAPLLSMAATVLVVLAAGTWFLTDKPVKQNQVAQRPDKDRGAEQLQATKPNVAEPVITTPVHIDQTPVKQAINRIAYTKPVKPAKLQVIKTTVKAEDKINDNVMPSTVQQEPVLAAVPNNAVLNPVVPDMSLTASSTTTSEPVLKAVTPVTTIAAQPEKTVKKRGIRSLGGLINAVIAKVDKREDKLIEFTESDEDQANITGINLGIIKIKKEK